MARMNEEHHTFREPSRWERLPVYDGSEPLIRVYQLPPEAIAFLTAHMEASDGVGLVRTLDESRGLIECWVMPHYLDVFEALMDALAKQFHVQEIGKEFD